MATRYYKGTQWLKQFVDLCADLVAIDRIQTVRSVRVPLDKRIATDAQLRWDTAGWYEITMNMHSHEYKNLGGQHFKKVRHRKDNLSNVLDSLAHELAHIKYKDHAPKHLILQCKILMRFAKHLKKLGVRDTSKPYDKEIKPHDS